MTRRTAAWAVVALLALAGVVRSEYMDNSVQLPVDRVVANVEQWIKEKPADAQARYVLGRIHSMAWAYGPQLRLWQQGARGRAGRGEEPAADPFAGQLPAFAPYTSVMVRRSAQKQNVTAEDAKHLAESIRSYREAVKLDENNAIYRLGLAWMLFLQRSPCPSAATLLPGRSVRQPARQDGLPTGSSSMCRSTRAPRRSLRELPARCSRFPCRRAKRCRNYQRPESTWRPR